MPVRYPAPCRRALPRPPAVVNPGIWVTDSMLCQAIERYHHVLVAPCRRLSSHTGPLESRRRLGRRHMTGLMQIPSSSSYRQDWHFEVASIPGLWHWEAPTTTKDRAEHRKKLTASGVFDKFIGWLEKSDAAQPFIQPPGDATVAYAAPAEALAEQTIMPEAEVQEAIAPLLLPNEIVELRSSINSAEMVDEDMLYRWCNLCRRSLRNSMKIGNLSVEGIILALDPLDSEAIRRISHSKVSSKITAMIRRTVVFNIDATQTKNTAILFQKLFMALADKMRASGGENQYIVLMRKVLDMMPCQARDSISPNELLDLTRAFVTAQANKHNLFSHWFSRTNKFAGLLQKLNATQRRSLCESMELSLQQEGTSSGHLQRLQFSWWMIKANDASLSRYAFGSMSREIMTAGLQPNSMQIWQLLTARALSTGLVEESLRKELTETIYSSMSQRWSALVRALLASRDGDAGVQELCHYLKSMGQMNTLIHALTSPPIRLIDIEIVRAFAKSCNDHGLALQLFETVRSKDETGAKTRRWGWSSWDAYVERMVKDPELDQLRVWRALNLARNSSKVGSAKETATEVEAKSQLLDKMGQWYLEAVHFTERQRLRHIQRCVSCQRSLTKTVSPQTLASVVELVTRDLEKGQWGRTQRMEWMVGMVAEAQGQESADGIAKALRGWRAVIDQTRKD